MKIKLNDKISIDLEKLIVSRLLAVANSGGGKSWLIRRIVEQAFGKVQIIILDPEGEFSTLRERYDFILCGKGMDAPAEPRSAALLARKLLESKSSAIIDLYELLPHDRIKFVRLFLESMINAPKNLYNDCLIILDEAHRFAPEKEESEALSSVVGMASLGRKRGFCLIPVTQRVSKLSKDVAAECNNKLMGRASLDLDRKRTADELGIRDKDEILALRNLEPGEFFAFGPAISNDVIKLKVGDVQTSPPKAGRQTKVAPPSAKVKKELAALSDLPAEAEQEAKTIGELHKTIKELRGEIATGAKPVTKDSLPIGVSQWKEYGIKFGYWEFFEDAVRKDVRRFKDDLYKKLLKTHGRMEAALEELREEASEVREEATKGVAKIFTASPHTIPAPSKEIERVVQRNIMPGPIIPVVSDGSLSGPEKKILDAIQWMSSIGVVEPEQTAVAFLAGYTFGGGGFNNPKGSLRTKGFIEYVSGNKIKLTYEGSLRAKDPDSTPTTQELHSKVLSVLDGPQQKILKLLLYAHPNAILNEELAHLAGYQIGGGFNNPKGRLRSLGLIEYLPGNMVRARDILFI